MNLQNLRKRRTSSHLTVRVNSSKFDLFFVLFDVIFTKGSGKNVIESHRER